jgi:peroxiredoxin
MTEPARRSLTLKQGSWTILLVLAVALLFGLVVLPELGKRPDAVRVGQAAPDFALPVLAGSRAGERVPLSSLRGKAVVLDFWASWCGPCREQSPVVDALAARHAASLSVLGVNTGDELEAARRFIAEEKVRYPSVLDADGSVAAAYGVSQLPTVVVIDRGGRVTAILSRFVDLPELERLVSEAATR